MGKRRAHGDGGLFVRDRGTDHERWVGRITLADGTRRDVYGRSQAEARRKLEKLKRNASLGLPITTERQTTGQFLLQWLEETARPTLRPTTYQAYETRVRLYLVPRLDKIPLAQLTPQPGSAERSASNAVHCTKQGGQRVPVASHGARYAAGVGQGARPGSQVGANRRASRVVYG